MKSKYQHNKLFINLFCIFTLLNSNMSDSLIIIPTFNEKENIEKIIRKVFSLEKLFHILL